MGEKVGSGERDGFPERMQKLAAGRQVELARAAGVSQQAISKWLRGMPRTLEMAIQIAKAAEVSLDWLLTGKERERANENQSASVPDPAILAEALAEYEIYRNSQPKERRHLSNRHQATLIVELYRRAMRQHAEKSKKALAIVRRK